MHDITDNRPVIAVTMGDPAGIGPELVLKAVKQREIPSGDARCLAVCSTDAMRLQAHAVGLAETDLLPVFESIDEFRASALDAGCIDVSMPLPADFRLGHPTACGGRIAAACIERAARMALEHKVAALVTAPVSKVALQMAGVPYPGHTEMLAALAGVDRVVMMLVGGGLHVAVATRHCPLREVPGRLNIPLIKAVVRIVIEHMTMFFGVSDPQVAVTGLNPHAGDQGRLGDEEADIIAPAVEELRSTGVHCVGPVPADVVFWQALHGRYDAVVAMYHDQGLGPLKTLAFDSAINVTLGLPVIRTSVDHGTAFDIAGEGSAHTGSLVAAFQTACRIRSNAGECLLARKRGLKRSNMQGRAKV